MGDRAIETEYPLLDPYRSFVAGTGDLDAGSPDGEPPHGLADLGKATRHLYAYGNATTVVPQAWIAGEGVQRSSAAYAGSPDLVYNIPNDQAFPDLEVWVYYTANVAVIEGFKLTIPETGDTLFIDTVAAAGATRIAKRSWATVLDGKPQGNGIKVDVYAKGNGVLANEILGVFIRRAEVAGDVPAGNLYDETFPTPSIVSANPDKPLSSDKMLDLVTCLTTLNGVREKVYLQWSNVNGVTWSGTPYLATLVPVIKGNDSYATQHDCRILTADGQIVTIWGSLDDLDDFITEIDTNVNVVTEGLVNLQEAQVPYDIFGEDQPFQQYYVVPTDLNDLKNIAISGP